MPAAASTIDAKPDSLLVPAGKTLVFGEIQIQDGAGRLAAHSTTTYALL